MVAQKITKKPKLDGILEEQEWPESPQAHLEQTNTDVFFSFDGQNLYIAAHRKPPPLEGKSKRRGEVVWTAETTGKDAEIWKDDSFEIFISDGAAEKVLYLGGSVSGASYDDLDGFKAWNGNWIFQTSTGKPGLIVEVQIPLEDLKKAGLDPNNLQINFQINRGEKMGEALAFLGPKGRVRCSNFVPLGLGKIPEVKARKFTVGLHFAEPEKLKPRERTFDVSIQGQKSLENFDPVHAAGGWHRAVVKEFANIEAKEFMEISFQHKSGQPILNAIEIRETK